MKITRQLHPRMPLNGWVDLFDQVYFATKNHERTETQILCRLVEHVGNLGKFVLKEPSVQGIGKYLARTFAWYCALLTRLDTRNLEELVWKKFPNVCTYCCENECQCDSQKAPASPDLLAKKRLDNEMDRPRDLLGFQEMFARIYNKRNVSGFKVKGLQGVAQPLLFEQQTLTAPQILLASCFGRLAEEVGEVAEAVRLRYFAPEKVQDELADIFAWLMAISNLVDNIHPEKGTFSLADYAWKYYPGKCLFCGESRCVCTSDPVEDVVTVAGVLISRNLDRLSGLGNSEAFDHLCTRIKERPASMRRSLPVSVILLDIDRFGDINRGRGGYKQGDSILAELGRLIRHEIVARGQAFRRGEHSDEFCVVVSNCPKEQSDNLVNSLRSRVSEHTFQSTNGRKGVKVAVSVGGATSDVEHTSIEELFRLAERAMRKDKRSHRASA